MKTGKLDDETIEQLISVMFPKDAAADAAKAVAAAALTTDKDDVHPKLVMRTIQWKPISPDDLEKSVFKDLKDGWVLKMLTQMGDCFVQERDEKLIRTNEG